MYQLSVTGPLDDCALPQPAAVASTSAARAIPKHRRRDRGGSVLLHDANFPGNSPGKHLHPSESRVVLPMWAAVPPPSVTACSQILTSGSGLLTYLTYTGAFIDAGRITDALADQLRQQVLDAYPKPSDGPYIRDANIAHVQLHICCGSSPAPAGRASTVQQRHR